MRRIEGIDDHPLEHEELRLAREGKPEESWRVKQEFLKQARQLPDHCSCPEDCPHHGNCYECVILHRGHRDHLPYCMWDMVNERIQKLSLLTEDSYKKE